jgi:hypothetical protein
MHTKTAIGQALPQMCEQMVLPRHVRITARAVMACGLEQIFFDGTLEYSTKNTKRMDAVTSKVSLIRPHHLM